MKDINILIVDDIEMMRTLLKHTLNQIGKFIFDEAAGGDEAIEKASNSHYDIVFLDIDMPGRDGLDTLRSLKTINKNIFVVMVSAYSDTDKLTQSLTAGASGYIVKTYKTNNLKQMVKRFRQQCPPLREVS